MSFVSLMGIDSGGTFTDFMVVMDDGTVESGKHPSTDDPSQAVRTILDQFPTNQDTTLLHGTTVATNALLEDELDDVLFVVNEGLEGVLRVGRGERKQLYKLNPNPDKYPFRNVATVGVSAREHPADESSGQLCSQEIDNLRSEVRAQSPDIVVVGLVHSFRNGKLEQDVKKALKPLEVDTVCSSELIPLFREYERFSTSVISAGLRSVVSDYLNKISGANPPFDRLYIMGSDRGLIDRDRAIQNPVNTVLSGPSAGIRGARMFGKRVGINQVISMDVGGTSTDVCAIDGDIPLSQQHDIGGYPLSWSMVDMHTIGSGGGSKLWIDPGQHLRVGPESAGANPGPACYGNGGPPTITDAFLTMGRIPDDRPLSSEIELSSDQARQSLQPLADQLNWTTDEVADGAVQLAVSQITESIREITVQEGKNPQSFSLAAFGGAGGLYAPLVAQDLGMKSVLVPRSAGIASAMGLLSSPHCAQRMCSPVETVSSGNQSLPGIEDLLSQAPKWSSSADTVRWEAQCQYVGQTHTLTLDISPDCTCGELHERFQAKYHDEYDYTPSSRDVELVHLFGFWFKDLDGELPDDIFANDIDSTTGSRTREVTVSNSRQSIPEFNLETLSGQMRGPCLLVGDTTTVFVPEQWELSSHPAQIHLEYIG